MSPSRIAVSGVVLVMLVGCSSTTASLRGFVAAPGAATDRATGLPTRVVHEASGITLVLIPAGEFMMGSPDDEPDRGKAERLHRRVIRRAFYLGESEVTVAQFRRFVEPTGYQTDAERGAGDGDNARVGSFAQVKAGDRDWNESANWRNPFPNFPELRPRDDHPVVHVSWNDAQAFARHFGLRLPTEAEWEYAYRAGTQTAYPWGDDPAGGAGWGNVADRSAAARFAGWSVVFPFDDGHVLIAPVRTYRPSAWGPYGMAGNVEEWVRDAYKPYPADGADESVIHDGATGSPVIRGAAWTENPGVARSASRAAMGTSSRRDFIGFRVAWTPSEQPRHAK